MIRTPLSVGRSRPFVLLSLFALGGVVVSSIAGGCGSNEDGASDGASSSGGEGGANGSSGTSGTGSSGTSGSGTSGSGTSGSGTSGSGTSGSADLPDVQFIYNAPPRDAALTGDSACAQSSATAGLEPLDMFITLDHTESMGTDCNIGQSINSKWCNAINALSTYFKSAAATGNAAALKFFNVNTMCDGTGLDTSVVPGGTTGYTTLPSSGFDSALNADDPVGGFGTRTESAIRGLTAFTGRAANRRAGRTTIGVIVTDGDPTDCVTNSATLSGLLQTHFTNTGIRTFLIGMTGANDSTLEAIATGGNAPLHANDVGGLTGTCGTSASPCRHWNVGGGDGAVLAGALKAIQTEAIGCTYNMPTTDAGVINPANVSVEYQPNGNPALATDLTKVDNVGACVANGWYYDNNTTPTTINLCPAQCTTVQADPNAKVRVLLGCLGG